MIKVDDKQIKEKYVAGKTTQGQPVLCVITHGGLQSYWTNLHGAVQCIGAAPHLGIAKWLAEKKVGGIEWAK